MKYPCDLIRDLLPLRADGACSEASLHAVEEHLSECAACRKLAEAGVREVVVLPEIKEAAHMGKKLFRHVRSLYRILGGIGYFMLGGWAAFLIVALTNPTLGVLGSLSITYFIYSVYLLCMSGLIVSSCVLRPKNIRRDGRIKAHAWVLSAAWTAFPLWWISFFIHNLFGWNSPSVILQRFDAVAAFFFFSWFLLLLVGGVLYVIDRIREKNKL